MWQISKLQRRFLAFFNILSIFSLLIFLFPTIVQLLSNMLDRKVLGIFSIIIYLIIIADFGSTLEPKTSLKKERRVKVDSGESIAKEKSVSVKRKRRDAEAPPAAPLDDDDDPDNPNRVDPFPLSFEWANFVKRMDEVVVLVKARAETLTTLLSDKNSDYASNKADYLAGFLKGFSKDFKPLAEIFQPLQESLDFNKAYTIIDPAVDLETLDACKSLAKANPTKEMDKGRLKWIEVNAMAATIHHIFNRLTPIFDEFGLDEIAQTLTTVYPSWTSVSIQVENGNTYVDMISSELIDYINTEMDSMGANYHLIRVLERLLHKKYGMVGWDPSKTNLNKYCFGNNKYGLIHGKFDVLIDAAEYMVMADMKFALIKMISLVYTTYKIEIGKSQEEKPDLNAQLEAIYKNMTAYVDKKIKFSPLAEVPPDVCLPTGPTVFRCDPTPVGCDGVTKPKISAPNCPVGVYVQDWVPYQNGNALTVPENLGEPIKLEDGTVVDCLAVEIMAFDPNGTIVPCQIIDKVCVDDKGNPSTEPYTVKLVPILIDETRTPHHRDILTETYPDNSQWGVFDCTTHFPHPLDPPQGPLSNDSSKPAPAAPEKYNCSVTDNDKGPGYIDCRLPGLNESNTAEFTLAFPGYLEAELVLSPEGKCIGTCQEYKLPSPTCTNKTTHCDLYRDSHCEKHGTPCMSPISKCPNKAKRCIRTSREITFCPAQPNSKKIYDWYAYADGKVTTVSGLAAGVFNGTVDLANPTCTDGNPATKVLERWEMEDGVILNAPQYCELCFCVCTDHMGPEGQHFFDIEALNADTANGFVVSGLRFEHTNKVMVLNIQQGKLLPTGKIDITTLQWLEPANVAGRTPNLIELGTNGFTKMNIDVIEPGTPGDVVTGVSWKLNDGTLTLSVGFNIFDSVKGTLTTDPPTYREAKWPVPKAKRAMFDLKDTVSPMKQPGPSQPYPITDNSRFIEFDASSLEKDGGQAVVPFFDLQPLLDEYSGGTYQRPIRNLGILYKSKAGSGGFLTPSAKF